MIDQNVPSADQEGDRIGIQEGTREERRREESIRMEKKGEERRREESIREVKKG
jgi:hypothetical protein